MTLKVKQAGAHRCVLSSAQGQLPGWTCPAALTHTLQLSGKVNRASKLHLELLRTNNFRSLYEQNKVICKDSKDTYADLRHNFEHSRNLTYLCVLCNVIDHKQDLSARVEFSFFSTVEAKGSSDVLVTGNINNQQSHFLTNGSNINRTTPQAPHKLQLLPLSYTVN